MILLFNLNSYLGGGEVLLVRLVRELHKKNENCGVLCTKGSYIEGEVQKIGAYCQTWPIANDSFVYMNDKEKKKIKDFLIEKFSCIPNLTVFTFCQRDTYNAAEFFKYVQNGHVRLCKGVYHPDEVKYISRLSIRKNQIIEMNRNVFLEYHRNAGIVFMNTQNLEASIPGAKEKDYTIIPLPIPLDKTSQIPLEFSLKKEVYNILWIGRFVDFKFTGIMNILKFVKQYKNFQLTMIGYGPYEKKIKRYIKKNNLQNVKLPGPIEPEEIKRIVKGMDIGYATGTSVLEIARYGIPTIISPMLGEKYCNKYSNVCMGVFGSTDDYNLGEVTKTGTNNFLKLDEVMEQIIDHYEEYSLRAKEFIQCFSLDEVVNKYQEFFEKSRLEACDVLSKTPTPGLFKRIYKAIYYKLKTIMYNLK